MKEVVKIVLLSMVLLNFSCQKDDDPQNEVRNYAEDSRILQDFVTIDKENLAYYLNLNAKSDLLRLIPTSSINQLEKVSNEHLNRFKDELNTLNQFIKNEIKNGASYVAMQTNNGSYFKELATNGVRILKNEVTLTAKKRQPLAEIGRVFFYRLGEVSSPENFIGKDHIDSQITINGPTNSISATLLCRTGTSPQGSTSNPSLLIISSMSGSYAGNFNWVNTESGDTVTWTFEGKLNTADFSVLGYAHLND
ncbi:hypothetical protein [Myroides sp. DW712]|uniref:hypothetical protein n=1 Tax=Myroides sp. DW712 TaxID=3389800 RepID=UPI00397DDE7C